MSASTPGRYRSRLFNLINHHSRRFIDRGERAIRHLKVAAVWGTQILLYPIYMVVQASLTALRQLSAEAKAGWTRLKALTQTQPPQQPPAVDTPIQQVLKEVETLSLPEPSQWKRLQSVGDQERQIVGAGLTDNVTQETDNLTKPALLGKEKGKTTFSTGRLKPQLHKQNLPTQVSQSSRVEIQGVASLLSTRTLVLVSVANEILDILTPEQQQKLAARISWELANLYRQWRLFGNLKASGVQRQLSHLAKPSVFLPLRLFWQLMAWVQTSPVAIAINLFGESTLSDYQEPMPAIASPTEIPQNLAYSWLKQFAPGGTLAAIDDTIAQWESYPLQTSNHVAIALRQRSQTLLQTFKISFITPRQPTDPTETSESHPFWLIGLIYAAIDYFFSQGSSHRFRQQEATLINPTEDINSTASVTLPGTEFSYTNEPDPWLVPLQNSLITGLSNNSQNRVFVKASPATFLEQTPTNYPTLLTHSTSLTLNTQNIPEKPIHHFSTSDIEPGLDWIETQAIPTGYVKHPLEQIIEWLDVGMLWLEDVTIKAWRWVRRLVVKNKG